MSGHDTGRHGGQARPRWRRRRGGILPAADADAGPGRGERILLHGVVPIFCVVLGAVLTVVADHLFGSGGRPADLAAAITGSAGLTPAEKATLLDLVTRQDQQFYDVLRTWLFLVSAPLGVLSWALADWIRSR